MECIVVIDKSCCYHCTPQFKKRTCNANKHLHEANRVTRIARNVMCSVFPTAMVYSSFPAPRWPCQLNTILQYSDDSTKSIQKQIERPFHIKRDSSPFANAYSR
ncbi:hypothetical protein TNCT_394401 [Trichonephila clavata]|uniref:Uncharacterized protein n=1 Tax=Trichonephila clavata TaxID=2740835 RepID=A0A8X6FP59_TRICU|nr:hypothetical protein TNCT_394401 [Trichonephila clavata]